MNRPLFRQMGGPAEPMPQDMMAPPMPQGMMAPPMPQGMMVAEEAGEGAGMQLANDMMANLENADDYQSLIDGIRGNEKPIEARYEELAGLVGDQDAAATPESVLTLIQPTIMLTEQGAMDSGIGELMQGLTSEVDMAGPMEEGVGSLMAAGAGNTPPVNFRDGGPVEVRGYQAGTEVRPGGGSPIIAQAERNVSSYEDYFKGGLDQQARAAALEEQNKMARAQMLFDIAGTALSFAGQTQGGSIAERLANSASQTQLTDKIGARASGILEAKQAQAAEDRQMRMAARQASLGQAQSDAAARQALSLAKAKSSAAKPVTLAPGAQLVAADGTLLATNSTVTPKTITLSPGQSTFDANGALIASMPAKPVTYSLSAGQAAYDAEGNLIVERADKPQVINLAPGAIAYDGNGVEIARGAAKPAVTHLLGKDQQLVGADGNVIAKGKETKETVTLGPGQQVVNVATGEVIAEGPNKFEAITMYSVVDGKVKKESVNVGTPEGIARAQELMALGYGPESEEAKAYLSEQIAIRAERRGVVIKTDAEIRAEGFRVSAEARLLDTTINSETRNVLTLIARESRAEETAIRQEIRANDTTLSAEDRAEARLLAKEARGELTTIRTEGRSLKAKIAAEKRDLEATIASEDRATARDLVVYGRNRADELADIAAQVASTIATEERVLGRTLNAEERAQITWETRNTITTQNDLDRLKIAQGLSDTSQIAAEDRKAIVDQNKFDQEQAAKYDAEQRAIADRDTIELRQVNGELVRVDTLTGETTVLHGEPKIPDPSMAQVTLRNAEGVPVTAVIDINSPQGKAVLAQVNAANAAAPGSASFQKVPTASTSVRGFLVPGEGVFTSYDGKTYVDEDGNAKPLPGGAFEVSSTIAYEVAKNEKMAVGAQAQLDALDIELVQGMTKIDGSPISRADMAEVKDAFAAARKGTGFWSKVYAGLDAVAGGLAPEAFGELFKNTTDARQFVKMVRVMGRSALASSPRFAVADLQTVEQLFPNEQTLFASPKTETRKLNDIVGYLTEEKVRILELFAGGSPMDSTMKSTLNQKLFEINRLESILGPVAMLGQASENAASVDAALETITRARKRAKEAEGK